MKLRVAAIDDHEVSLVGLRHIFAASAECELVATYASCAELLAATPRGDFDVVLLDLRLPDSSDPFQNAVELKECGYEVLIYSSMESPFLLRRALRAGVSGAVSKAAPTAELFAAIRAAAHGETFANPEWADAIDADPIMEGVPLSPRQREILELYAMGESAKRVAEVTGLSAQTVQDYLGRIRLKYSLAGRPARTKIELYRRAQEDGYIAGPWED